jgi:radical SAM protein with 4Fe4S-binding SPASM domain
MANIIGDLNKEMVSEVWNGDKRKEFIRMHLRGERWNLPACAHCEYINFSPDNIDPYRERLLTK